MEAALFAKILSDRTMIDLKKLKYKYPSEIGRAHV